MDMAYEAARDLRLRTSRKSTATENLLTKRCRTRSRRNSKPGRSTMTTENKSDLVAEN